MRMFVLVTHSSSLVRKRLRDKSRNVLRRLAVTSLSLHYFGFVFSGADPVAVYRWSILRSFFKAVHAFKVAGREHRSSKKRN